MKDPHDPSYPEAARQMWLPIALFLALVLVCLWTVLYYEIPLDNYQFKNHSELKR